MVASIFPGQGSQRPGMGQELHDHSPDARAVFDKVADATSLDVRKLCFETDEETLRQTQNAQLALYTCGIAAHEALRQRLGGKTAGVMAGHSIGEYTALASAGIVSIEDGARLVQKRGDLMARSGNLRPGTMAAVLGLNRNELQNVCNEVADKGAVVIANDNCPGQLVISGDINAVQAACALASEKGAKRVIPLNVSGAFHSPLMDEPAKAMREALDQVTFQPSSVRLYSNVTTEPVDDPKEWPMLLEAQLKRPVLWTDSVAHMIRDDVKAFVELGSGEVLTGLVKRIHKGVEGLEQKTVQAMSVIDPITLDQAAATLGEMGL